MYKHNPLPANISKLQSNKRKVQRKNIVFSSPKLKCFSTTEVSREKSKITNSSSLEKSIHKINSKEKPHIFTYQYHSTVQKIKSIQMSTVQPYQNTNLPSKNQHVRTNYFNVDTLLRNMKNNNYEMTKSITQYNKKSNIEPKILKIQNQDKRIFKKILNKKQNKQISQPHINIVELIQVNYWQKYQGQTINRRFHGYGTLYFINGDKFMGFFQNQIPQGHGSFYNRSADTVTNGIWQNGIISELII